MKITLDKVFEVARILKTLEIKEDIKQIDLSGKTKEEVGTEIIGKLLNKLLEIEAEKKVYAMLKILLGKSVEEMGISEIKKELEELAEENDLTSFFQLASKSMRQ